MKVESSEKEKLTHLEHKFHELNFWFNSFEIHVSCDSSCKLKPTIKKLENMEKILKECKEYLKKFESKDDSI